jgi:hypothetical protein
VAGGAKFVSGCGVRKVLTHKTGPSLNQLGSYHHSSKNVKVRGVETDKYETLLNTMCVIFFLLITYYHTNQLDLGNVPILPVLQPIRYAQKPCIGTQLLYAAVVRP